MPDDAMMILCEGCGVLFTRPPTAADWPARCGPCREAAWRGAAADATAPDKAPCGDSGKCVRCGAAFDPARRLTRHDHLCPACRARGWFVSKGEPGADGVPDDPAPDDAPLALAAGDVLGRALALVTGDRAAQHGDKMDNMANIARLAQAWLDIRADPGAPLSAADAAVMMILVKLARTQSGAFNPDDWIDAAGYCAVGGEVAARMRVGLDEASGRGGADPARDLRDLLALTEDDGPRHGLILPGAVAAGAEG